MKVLLSLIACIFFSIQYTNANTIIVVNTNDTGVGSLRDAISMSSNLDTIRFNPNILSSGNDTIKLASAININRNLVIIGLYNNSAALYINGDNSYQIFNADLSSVSSPIQKSLTIDSLQFINGNSSSGGGAIKFKGRYLNVSNSTFTNNTSTYGGAIASLESFGSVNINTCTFNSNSANNSSGGGIYSGGEIILINSDFSNNEAVRGGAVAAEEKMSIENSTFLNNTATENGGAVNLSSNTSTSYYPISVTNSTFENNSANFGGGIYAYFFNTEVDLNIDNSTFNNNHAVWSGGAISAASYWYTSSININDSNITNNTSDDAAAGISCSNVNKTASVLANNCLINNNIATGIGGGISVSTATQNSSPSDTAYMHIVNSEITNNSASKGGGLSCRGTGGASGTSLLMVENSIISNNIATIDGGGIYNFASASKNTSSSFSSKATTIINSSTINDNQSSENGGGLFSNSYSAASNAASKSLIYINQSTFVNNTAIDDGGAIGNYSRNNGFTSFNEGVSVHVNNSTIYNNDAANGGAVSSKFSSFSSASDPGAMAAQFSSSIIALNGRNNIHAADSIVSLGYNIFSDATIAGSITTDQMAVDPLALSLGSLQLNGGSTPTLLPSISSVALNAGNPSDMTDAQNAPIIGVRDVGSAEYLNLMNVVECDSFIPPSGNPTYYTSGFYTDTILVNGVDSLVYINLTISNPSSTLTETICTGETYISPSGNTYTISSDFMDTIPSYLNCDSIISISLIVLNESTSSIDVTSCSSYTSPSGILYEITGVYNDTISNAVGCDSIITIDLTILNPSIGTDTQTACESYTWMDGINYTENNNSVTYTLINTAGCDSIVTLDLTILNLSISTDTQTACESYTWIDGITYTENNNSATHTLTNAAGCDSIVTLDLTILNPSTGTDTQTACESYTWIDGITYTTNNNSATHTLINTAGCDSIVTLDLIILNPSIGTDTQTACESYTWIDGITYTTNNNSATHTLINIAGCDSIVTLNLTILNPSIGTDTQTACESYTWIDGITYTENNNSATHTLTNAVGCDSILTLDLIILNSSTGTDTQTACESYTWIDGITYTENNNSATHTLTNIAGCDSIVTLNLTINTVDIGTTLINDLTIEANAIDANYQWLDCDDNYSIIAGEANQSYTPLENGNYAVEISQNGCIDTSACVVISTVGLIENNFGQHITVYPNPTLGKVIIKFQNDNYHLIHVKLINSIGQLISTNKYSQINNLEVDIEGAPGVYFIEIETSNGKKATFKIIKQ